MDDTIRSVVVRLIDALEASGETYVIGGALALAAWSEPRATADVDIVLWMDLDRADEAIKLVQDAGVEVDPVAARAQVVARGMFVGRVGIVRVDVFMPSIDFYEQAKARRVPAIVAGRNAWIHSAEVLAVFKMLFFRPKDLLDIERMLQVQGAAFDRAFVRGALVDMFGTDSRIDKWDEIAARVSLVST